MISLRTFWKAVRGDIVKSILKYPGGWRISEWIIEHFPKHNIYVEPYFGSGGVIIMQKESIYKKICANPYCQKQFETSNPRTKYCSNTCRNKMNRLSASRNNKLRKQWKTCKSCGRLIYVTCKENYCNEECKKAYEELVRLRRKCKKCKYFLIQDDMCGYYIKTGKLRYPNTYPCNVYEPKREG